MSNHSKRKKRNICQFVEGNRLNSIFPFEKAKDYLVSQQIKFK